MSQPIKGKTLNGQKIPWRNIGIIVLAIALAAIPFCYGKYREFNTNDPFDSGLNVYSAQQIVNGGKLGVEVFASARPATLLVNVIGVSLFGYSEWGPKLIQTVMQLAALGLMFYTLRKVYGNFPAAVALILASFYLSCPRYAKFGNVKEQFMIACMIVAACGLILRHTGGLWWWLLISGAAAINTYYFKPTGVSVCIAMAIYILAQPIFRQRTWRESGKDILFLFLGAAIGLMPLSIFYLWQGRFIPFFKDIPVIKVLVSLFQGNPEAAIGGGAYLAGSKKVSDFANQFATVFSYYQSFVVPIGFGLLAIGWRMVLFIRHLFNKTVKSQQDHFVLLFGIWWILDMAFVWISPRSYVQYYLPLNASAAMLAAYVLYRCGKQPLGFIWLLVCWIVTNFLLLWLVASDSALGIGLRDSSPKGYWLHFLYHLIPIALSCAAYYAMKAPDLKLARQIIITLIGCVMIFVWNSDNLSDFKEKISLVQKQKQNHALAAWELIGNYIRENSLPSDGLYVWGWYPGIYVTAQRFSPASQPAESNMHTDSPGRLTYKTKVLVEELKAEPPKFIVDSQKEHYPFYTHPNFDLWPRYITGEHKGEFWPAQYAFQLSEQHSQFVEQYTYMHLTNPKRRGGPVDSEKARELAQEEKARHEAMYPLREFIMQNYQPLNLNLRSQMVVFQYKGSLSGQ